MRPRRDSPANVVSHPQQERSFVIDPVDISTVRVELGPRSYEIHIASDGLPSLAGCVERWLAHSPWGSAESERGLIITDRNVAQPHAVTAARSLTDAGWTCEVVPIDAGEQSKSLAVVSGLYDTLVNMQADRRTVIFAVGGGVVGDTAGYVAATYARGLPFVQVPTTLLAHVDSSVGGKVGINHPRAKNLIGAFYQPLGVFCDTTTLETLPDREYRSGLAEVVKYGVILDASFFEYLEQHAALLADRDPETLRYVIAHSCRLKARVVEQDEQERTGLRAVLNYGHTFAHAYEALAGYGTLLHGEAVAIGMVDASRLAERRGLIDSAATRRQVELLQALGLPTARPKELAASADEFIDRMRLDKKSQGGKLRFVLPTRLGHVELFGDVAENDVREVLRAG